MALYIRSEQRESRLGRASLCGSWGSKHEVTKVKLEPLETGKSELE